MAWLALDSGRLLEPVGDDWSRGMTVHDRTRLIGELAFFLRFTSFSAFIFSIELRLLNPFV